MSKIGQKKMLIVDDIEINRAILSELFTDEYTILEATNGVEALQVMKSSIDDLKVILLDVVMPIMDGFSTLTEMMKTGYLDRVPVIAMTAGDGMDHDVGIIDMGAEDLISKPFVAGLVKKRVRNVICAWEYQKLIKAQGEK